MPISIRAVVLGLVVLLPVNAQLAQRVVRPNVPRVWDDHAIETLEVPLANPAGSPKHVSSDFYYGIPVRPIYKTYPVYAPGHEPEGYMDWLKQREPEIVWDDAGVKPILRTENDWIAAGEAIFDAPIYYTNHRVVALADVRNPEWYQSTGAPVAKDGTLPYVRYVVRQKGSVDLGNFACGFCHSRVIQDGRVIKGAQGNFPFEKSKAWSFRLSSGTSRQLSAKESALRRLDGGLFAVPWISSDPLDALKGLSFSQLVSAHAAIPAEVIGRHRLSLFLPVPIPDLIGVKDRHYLDRTGLQKQRSIADLMRYAALNQGVDDLASYDGFVPAEFLSSKAPLDPADPVAVGGRYSDEQLYALALYLYSLEPPPNPNKMDSVAARGKKIFQSEGCAVCHTAPLYTNNKLIPAEGFRVPPGARASLDVLLAPVATDPNLTLRTRRGTGYYKVPSIRGVWYRSMFGHNGWCATLEDWFDPKRVRDDYVPTGFRPYGTEKFAVKGHVFGLHLSAEDRKALIAFLATL